VDLSGAGSPPPDRPSPADRRRRYVFVTGQLAREALERALGGCGRDFDWRVEALRIKVAALLTTDYLAATLPRPAEDAVYLPGLCQADTEALERRFGRPFLKGPKDLRDLPEFFGEKTAEYRPDGEHAVTILAEINDVHRLSDEAIVDAAERYRRSGADVIDLGCTPGHPLTDAGRIVRLLRGRGHRVSIDTFDETEALAADEAGAEFLLSLNSENLPLAGRLRAVPVVIPDPGGGVPSLLKNVDAARARGATRIIADPVLEPIHFGLAASIRRYCEVREALPDVEMMMGVGNLTELTEADSAGVNAILLGLMSELRIGYALTTEVIPWARGAVRELDCGRRMMHHARGRGALPKGFDHRLVTTRDVRLTRPSEAELRGLQERLTDRNFRIETDGEAIFVFNGERFVKGTNIRDLFPLLGVGDDASHAFYLGRELMKADIARRLGKKYIQGEPLHWGYLSWEEEEAAEDHARRRRRREGRTT
jgi:dihydropteroate synthase-like protein